MGKIGGKTCLNQKRSDDFRKTCQVLRMEQTHGRKQDSKDHERIKQKQNQSPINRPAKKNSPIRRKPGKGTMENKKLLTHNNFNKCLHIKCTK